MPGIIPPGRSSVKNRILDAIFHMAICITMVQVFM